MTLRGRTGMLLPLLLVLWTGTLISAEPPEQKDLDEVVVQGSAVQLNKLRDEIRETEDLFYDRFNELNTVRDFDVHCRFEEPTGTRLEYRKCYVVFEEDALEEVGQEAIRIRQFHESSKTGVITGPPPDPTIKTSARRPLFQKHMKEIVSRDPELTRLLNERQELTERYEALRRALQGLAPAPAGADESTTPP